MSKREDYENKTAMYLTPILDKYGFSLYDIEYVKEGGDFYLRAYIDKPEGITIEDCVTVSREMNEILDAKDYIDEVYTFEVSSPGVERILRKDEHYKAAIDKEITVKTFRPIDGKKEFTGILRSFSDDMILLSMEDESKDLSIPRKDIAKANMAFSW